MHGRSYDTAVTFTFSMGFASLARATRYLTEESTPGVFVDEGCVAEYCVQYFKEINNVRDIYCRNGTENIYVSACHL